MITYEKAESAINYLAQSEEEFGKARAYSDFKREERKHIKAILYLKVEGTDKAREAEAYAAPRYKQALDEMKDAIADFEIIKAKRLRAELTIEMWRSTNAANKKGNI